MPEGFDAQYSGRCGDCGGQISPGDRIRRVHTGGAADYFVHVTCPDSPLSRLDIAPGEQVCPRCFLIHPDGACDA